MHTFALPQSLNPSPGCIGHHVCHLPQKKSSPSSCVFYPYYLKCRLLTNYHDSGILISMLLTTCCPFSLRHTDLAQFYLIFFHHDLMFACQQLCLVVSLLLPFLSGQSVNIFLNIFFLTLFLLLSCWVRELVLCFK